MLDARSQRTLVFSAGTRNSFVVLPFALALPPKLRPAVAVIVHQLLIKLSATMIYWWSVPNRLVPREAESTSR